ncbi:MAG: prenyltransferase, partial [Bacteroidales bacterium]|nr:prenyltransferase [Bacteroidales bacterium]
MRKTTGFKYPLSIQKKGAGLILSEWIIKPISFEENSFTFLNQSKNFFGNDMDWDFSSFGKLWTYNLNYFDFLNQSKNNIEEKLEIIKDFFVKLNSNSIALEPYTIALRGINWIKFL